MRKTIQLVLFLFAVFALVVTGVAFYQIVLASTIHGTPVSFIATQAGPYLIKLALYNDPINAGDAIPFAVSAASGTRGSLTYQVTASPGPGVPAWLAWNIGLLPLSGLLLFWIVQTRRAAKQRPEDEHTQRVVVTEITKEVF